MKKIILSTTLLLSTFAFASNPNLDNTKSAISETLESFSNNQSQEMIDSFNGIKAWPVSGGVKVKIYLLNKSSISYSCHRHEVSEPFECHEN